MEKKILWVIFLAIFLLAGCSPADTVPAGVHVTDLTVAIGGAEVSGDQQVVTYKVTLQNSTQNYLTVRWVEPVLNEPIAANLIGESPRITVVKTLAANNSSTFEGQFSFDSSGATKAQISSWEPFVKEVLIAAELRLSLPPQSAK